ncbi:MAG: GH3 auxin-responsive promoter family protein [Leptospiraceae bacterium]|nr:GH3 auxin-responsive promoter family protein [Leptospiraceae bacterium]
MNANKGKAKEFYISLDKLENIQKKYLLSNLFKNKNTAYGKKYNFKNINTTSEYQKYVPITIYEDYKEYIQEILNGEKNVLTNEDVLLFEMSSGSTSNTKLIPYTKSLKQEFQNGIAPWIYDLYSKRPSLLYGKSYWSITPIIQNSLDIKSKIPIGFEEDGEYLGKFQKFIVDKIFAAPKILKHVSDIFIFRYITLLFLLKEKNLSLISVWNPSFLILLLEPIYEYKNIIMEDLEKGTLYFSDSLDKKLIGKITSKLGKNRNRSNELKCIFRDGANLGELYSKIWPNLNLISCWGDGNAKQSMKNLSILFPNVEIQEKGLLATEGIVSFPFFATQGKVLAYRSHFFEFEDKTNGEIKLAHEVKAGHEYSVILTTGGGFYRYKLNDIVQVIDFFQKVPLLTFLGKEDTISDYFGEKLNECFVKEILINVFDNFKLQPDFYMVAPENEKNNFYFYTLYIECRNQNEYFKSIYPQIRKDIEQKLKENFHYNYCRKLGQLQFLRIFLINGSSNQDYLIGCQKLNQKLGNIKPVILHTKMGWKNVFKGEFLT